MDVLVIILIGILFGWNVVLTFVIAGMRSIQTTIERRVYDMDSKLDFEIEPLVKANEKDINKLWEESELEDYMRAYRR